MNRDAFCSLVPFREEIGGAQALTNLCPKILCPAARATLGTIVTREPALRGFSPALPSRDVALEPRPLTGSVCAACMDGPRMFDVMCPGRGGSEPELLAVTSFDDNPGRCHSQVFKMLPYAAPYRRTVTCRRANYVKVLDTHPDGSRVLTQVGDAKAPDLALGEGELGSGPRLPDGAYVFALRGGDDPLQAMPTKMGTARYSPDGKWILYSPVRTVGGGLFLMDELGQNDRQVTFPPGLPVTDSMGDFLPDGRLVFTRGNRLVTQRIDVPGVVEPIPHAWDPALHLLNARVSRDGKHLAVVARRPSHTARPEDTLVIFDARTFAHLSDIRPESPAREIHDFDFLADGKSLVFSGLVEENPGPLAGDWSMGTELFRVDLDGKHQVRVTDNGWTDTPVRVIPRPR